jgi:phosphatidylglycerophosphatase A
LNPGETHRDESAERFRRPQFSVALWLAQGFGVGRIPVAPGTFGSIVGVLWFLLLLAARNPGLYFVGTIAGIGVSVPLCGVAEKILKQCDPGSVVLDEIIALPICFFGWVGILYFKNGAMPAVEYFFSPGVWPLTLGVFAAFRFFDVLKPWPVRQSQSLPGGWGVTVDDVLAALYVNVVILLIYGVREFISRHH